MTTYTAARAFLLAAIVVGGLSAAGPSMTAALFSDSQDGSGTFSAGEFSPPPADTAYIDHGNGTYTEVPNGDLLDFDDANADLVIPEGAEPVGGGNQQDVSITAGSITSEVDLGTKNALIDLHATDGDIDVRGTTIERTGGGSNDGIHTTATGDVNLANASVITKTQPIEVEAGADLILDGATVTASGGGSPFELVGGTVTAEQADLYNKNNGITIAATDEPLDADGAMIETDGGSGDLSIESNGDTHLNGTTIDLNNGQASADLEVNSATLFVQGTVIDTSDDVLHYTPGGIIIDPASRDGTDVQG